MGRYGIKCSSGSADIYCQAVLSVEESRLELGTPGSNPDLAAP